MDPFLASYVALWIVVVAQGLMLIVVLRQFGEMYLSSRAGISRDGLNIGDAAPRFEGVRSGGSAVRLNELLGRWVVLIFASTGCSICRELLPSLAPIERDLQDAVSIHVLLRASPDEAEAYVEGTHTDADVIAIGREGVAEQYKVRVSPFAHILDPEGVVRAKGLVNDREGVEHLLSDAGMKHLALEKHLPVVAGAHG